MKRVELLAPSGTMEALKAAIIHGTDAVYLGGSQFGARAYANNFNDEEIVNAIKFAHLYNVKVYVTVNTLIYDHEFKKVIKYIDFLYHNDVDAIIIQDLGLMKVIREYYPDLELHASTQMTVHNTSAAKLLKEEGLSRVVLARENSLEEITTINNNVDIETEIFVHGALCVCYSGQCLMSSLIGGRSGNRGRCAQPCRKLYDLMLDDKIIERDKYLISPRDLNTIEHLGEIIKSGVSSLKIEGRMKNPEYVAVVVSLYRKAIDQFYQYGKVNICQSDLGDLTQIFNRGFTKGFMFHENGEKFINKENSSNSGVLFGVVNNVSKYKVSIKCLKPLHIQDGIFFGKANRGLIVSRINVNGKNVEVAKSGEIATIDFTERVSLGEEVYKTRDYLLETKANSKDFNKIKVNGLIDLYMGKNPTLFLSDELGNKVNIKSDFIIQESINQCLDKEKIKKQLSKMGNTPFTMNDLVINQDENIFVLMSTLNDLRRSAVEKLIELRENKYLRSQKNTYKYQDLHINRENKLELSVYCHNIDQVEATKACGIKRIYVNEDIYNNLSSDNNIYCVRSRIKHNNRLENNDNMLISDLGSLYYVCNNSDIVTNFNLNVTNSETIKYLLSKGVSRITLSYEMNEKSYRNLLLQDKSPLEIIIYGYQEVMVTKYCIFSDNCENCPRKQNKKKYHLVDSRKEKFFVTTDKSCNMHIFNSKNMILSDDVLKLIDYGYFNYRINLTVENYEESVKVINAYKEIIEKGNLDYINDIIDNHKNQNLFTRGYFNKDIL